MVVAVYTDSNAIPLQLALRWFLFIRFYNNMANWKKGFMLYADLIHTLERLTDAQAWQLFKHILRYVNDENPEINDILLEVAFEPIKQTLKRDLVKWEERAKRSRENWMLWGRPNNPKEPSGLSRLQNNPDEPRKPDSVSVSVTDSVSVNNILEGKKSSSLEQEKKETKKFAKPTVAEVAEYCKERGNGLNAEQFVNYNESKGWVVGNSKMKDRKAAVRTWELNAKARKQGTTSTLKTSEQIMEERALTIKRMEDERRATSWGNK